MSPEAKAIATAALVAALVGGAALLTRGQVDTLPALDETTLPVVEQAAARALARADGGIRYVTSQPNPDGGEPIVKRLQRPPCAWWPTGAVLPCRFVDGGSPGRDNTIQPGQWVGLGCRRKACVIYAGEPEDDAQLVPPQTDDAKPVGEVAL